MRFDIGVNDYNLRCMYAEMSQQNRGRVWRTALRRCARDARGIAVAKLRSSGLKGVSAAMVKGMRGSVNKRGVAGFYVTVRPSIRTSKRGGGKVYKGFHRNRRGQDKPVLLWASLGSQPRYRNGGKVYSGRMPKYDFMERADRAIAPHAGEWLRQAAITALTEIAKKYGGK